MGWRQDSQFTEEHGGIDFEDADYQRDYIDPEKLGELGVTVEKDADGDYDYDLSEALDAIGKRIDADATEAGVWDALKALEAAINRVPDVPSWEGDPQDALRKTLAASLLPYA